MTNTLTKAEVLEQIDRMNFGSTNGEKVRELVACMDESGRVSSEKLATALFPGKTPKTIMDNTANRIRWINEAAGQAHIPLQAVLASDDSGWSGVQVEWTETPPPEAMVQDLVRGGYLVTLPASSDRMQTGVDTRPIVLVVCNDFEAAAVDHFFDPENTSREDTKNGRTYSLLALLGKDQAPTSARTLIVMVRSEIGPLSANQTVEWACDDWKPQLVLGVGIAYGVDESKQHYGDVLVSRAVVESGENVRATGDVFPRTLPISAPTECLSRMRRRNQKALDRAIPWPEVDFGTILSTNQKISNTAYRNQKVGVYDGFGVIGGDMEAAGIASASSRQGVPWLVVKAISDFASDDEEDPDKKKARQKEAALRAARVVYSFLTKDFPVEPLGVFPDDHETSDAPLGMAYPEPQFEDNTKLSDKSRLTLQAVPYNMAIQLFKEDGNSHAVDSEEKPGSQKPEAKTDILADLDKWINDPSGKPLFAIFGDYGMGKTITCQSFAKRQRERCQTSRNSAWPLYFDLRKVQVKKGVAPTLMNTMLQCAHRGWKRAENVTPKDIWSWINRGAVVIFDGLDEVLTKLDEDAGQMYTDDLLSVINQADDPDRVRVLVSSRSQFFRNLEEERTRFTGAERNDKDASWYEARLLLPLTEEQIRHYFEASLPSMDVDQVMTMVSEVHNLSDLSQRPYTLKLVGDAIPEITQQQGQGLLVNASTIYRNFARKWLRRDDLKHHIKLERKLSLVEELASQLWTTGRTEIPIEELEEWFDNWGKNHKGWKRRKKVSRDKLEEDLRNSTFLSRVNVSETRGEFRFAHTSLAEFFLSEYMLRALEENAPERWAMRPPSEETYGFLGMSLAEKDESTRQELLTTMGSWFVGTDRSVNNAILFYRLYASYDQIPQVTLPLIRPQVDSLPVDEARQLLKTMKKGEHLCVGGYSWTLLDKGDKTALLLCDQIVDYHPYNTEYVDVTWQTCTLRTWLNHDFLSTLPQDFQDAMATVDASREELELATGKKDADKLFPLTFDQVKNYFPESKTRIANRHDGDTWWWWLRSVGASRGGAPIVLDGGSLLDPGGTVHYAYAGVRPALKMNL